MPDCPIRDVIVAGKLNPPAVSPPGKLNFWSFLSIWISFSRIRALRIANMNENPIRFLIGDLSSDTIFKNPALFTDWLESTLAQNGAQKYCHGRHNLFRNFSHLFRCFLVWKWEIGTFSVLRNPQNSRYWFKSKPVNCMTTAFLYLF